MIRKSPLPVILFAHSAGAQYGKGKGSYDLVQYLRKKLAGKCRILFPKVSKPNTPTYSKYKTLFKASFKKLTGPVIIVGHSLGASTLLKYLSEEKPAIPIAGLFMVSTPFWKSNMKEFQLKPNFQQSIELIQSIYFYHSKQDQVVPFDHLSFYKEAFKIAKARELRGKEHIFSHGLPELVSDIKSIVDTQ